MNKLPQQGFTLVEILVAAALFSIISFAIASGLVYLQDQMSIAKSKSDALKVVTTVSTVLGTDSQCTNLLGGQTVDLNAAASANMDSGSPVTLNLTTQGYGIVADGQTYNTKFLWNKFRLYQTIALGGGCYAGRVGLNYSFLFKGKQWPQPPISTTPFKFSVSGGNSIVSCGCSDSETAQNFACIATTSFYLPAGGTAPGTGAQIQPDANGCVPTSFFKGAPGKDGQIIKGNQASWCSVFQNKAGCYDSSRWQACLTAEVCPAGWASVGGFCTPDGVTFTDPTPIPCP